MFVSLKIHVTSILLVISLSLSVFGMEKSSAVNHKQIYTDDGIFFFPIIEHYEKPYLFGPVIVTLLKDSNRTKIGEMEIRFDDEPKRMVLLNLRNHTIDKYGKQTHFGIGRILIDIAKDTAVTKGYPTIFVAAWCPNMVPFPQPLNNNPAEFYKKNGFNIICEGPLLVNLEYSVSELKLKKSHEEEVDSLLIFGSKNSDLHGYFASAKVASLIDAKDLLPQLKQLCEEDGRLVGDFQTESFEKYSNAQGWEMKVKKYGDSIDISFSSIQYDHAKVLGLPESVKLLTHKVFSLIPDGVYKATFRLVSDFQRMDKTDIASTDWHQDKSELDDFPFIFFMEVYRFNFGDSPLKIGIVSKKYLNKEKNNFANTVSSDNVKILCEIDGGEGAGYLINQNFEDDGHIIVHKSPDLIKKSKESRRYKVILRIGVWK